MGLNGAILVSPALEFALLDTSDYDLLPWIDVLPSMAAGAAHHGRAPAFEDGALGDRRDHLGAERVRDRASPRRCCYSPATAFERERPETDRGRSTPSESGLDRDIIERSNGRISPQRFVRELLKDQGLVCGLYDATVTTSDPYPDRDSFGGPDPTLRSIERVFAAGINTHLRRDLGLVTSAITICSAWR